MVDQNLKYNFSESSNILTFPVFQKLSYTSSSDKHGTLCYLRGRILVVKRLTSVNTRMVPTLNIWDSSHEMDLCDQETVSVVSKLTLKVGWILFTTVCMKMAHSLLKLKHCSKMYDSHQVMYTMKDIKTLMGSGLPF